MFFLDKILNIIYPQVCVICGKGRNTFLCKKCEIKLKKEAVFGNDKYEDKYFENHFYLFKYEGIIRKLLLNYKFKEQPYLYESFVNFFNKYQKKYLQFDFYDIIIIVPISKKRLNSRGYNQSLLIGRKISKELKVKLNEDILIKQKNNLKQSSLNKNEREQNVKDVYNIKNIQKIKNKKILLIDDIFTTGSTVNECSKVLIKAGAKKVDVFTIAKD